MKTKIVVRSSVGGKEIQWTGTLQDALDQVQAAYSNPGQKAELRAKGGNPGNAGAGQPASLAGGAGTGDSLKITPASDNHVDVIQRISM